MDLLKLSVEMKCDILFDMLICVFFSYFNYVDFQNWEEGF